MRRIALRGVPRRASTRASPRCTSPRRAIPYSMRVAATKLPLKIFRSDRNAAKTTSRARTGEPNARANAASVPRPPATSSLHGKIQATAAMTIA